MMPAVTRRFSHLVYSHTTTDRPLPEHFERHCHDTFEILYVVRGTGKYVVEGVEYPLKPHTLLLTRPYEFHYVCPNADSAYERYVINFDRSVLIGAASALSLLIQSNGAGYGAYFVADAQHTRIRAIFAEMDEALEMFCASKHRAEREETFFAVSLTRLLFYLSVEQPRQALPNDDNLSMRVIGHINGHLSEPLSLDELAQRFYVSKYYLCHAFHRQTGVSIFTYVNTKRIALAEQLLAEGEPATSVAYTVGYTQYSSFYRAFVKQTGRPPTGLSYLARSKKSENQ